MAGTSWAGKTAEGWDMTIEFLPEGKMTVSYNRASFNRASWKQDGDKVYYEMNDRYCEFEGKFVRRRASKAKPTTSAASGGRPA